MSLRDALAALHSEYDAAHLAARYAAAAKIIAAEEKRRVRRVGDRIDSFDIDLPDEGSVSSKMLLERGPLLVNFYRGLWCSYCQKDLIGTEELVPAIREAGASVIVMTGGVTNDMRAKLRHTAALSFPIIDDSDGAIAQRFGLRWSTSDTNAGTAAMGMNLVTLRGPGPWILPMQARYLIQRDGVIAFANVAFDYYQRTEPAAVLPTLARIAR